MRYASACFLFGLLVCETAITYAASPIGQPDQESRAIVLVIDKSGSMLHQHRMDYAKDLIKSIGRQLNVADYLGVVAFDMNPFVVIQLDEVGRLRQEDLISKRVDPLKPGGNTYFFPALAAAKGQFEGISAAKKHIVLLSDGLTRGNPRELIDSVSAMKELAIRVSTVALGAETDMLLLRRIAYFGGGSFQFFCNPSDLAQVTLESVLSGTTSLEPDERFQNCR
jgi:Mg-chelatase subunit ChlD